MNIFLGAVPNRNRDIASLYTIQSVSPIAPLSAVYKGSTSILGAVTVLLSAGFVITRGFGSVFDDNVGVVAVFTEMLSGRMVPAMAEGLRSRVSGPCHARNVAESS